MLEDNLSPLLQSGKKNSKPSTKVLVVEVKEYLVLPSFIFQRIDSPEDTNSMSTSKNKIFSAKAFVLLEFFPSVILQEIQCLTPF